VRCILAVVIGTRDEHVLTDIGRIGSLDVDVQAAVLDVSIRAPVEVALVGIVESAHQERCDDL
jgi:hypothetical protein